MMRTADPGNALGKGGALLACLSLAGCLSSSPPASSLKDTTTTPTATPTATIPAGDRAVKIKFLTGDTGSFAAPNGDTVVSDAGGQKALYGYRTDTDQRLPSMPLWLPRVAVGVSGQCATFASSEIGTLNCWSAKDCSAQGNFYRISEIDCRNEKTTVGTGDGSANDKVYVRAVFSRDSNYLGPTENILVAIEYSATSFLSATADPKCLADGTCSDFIWDSYLRKSNSDIPQRFMMFIPRMTGYTNQAANRTGGEVNIKQIILPLAANPDLTVFQLSRTSSRLADIDGSIAPGDSFISTCGTGSPLCAGVVIRSITFYRI